MFFAATRKQSQPLTPPCGIVIGSSFRNSGYLA
jgi:hypothetical protein